MFDMVLNTRIWSPCTTQAQITITIHTAILFLFRNKTHNYDNFFPEWRKSRRKALCQNS